jgi:hypothetical protein
MLKCSVGEPYQCVNQMTGLPDVGHYYVWERKPLCIRCGRKVHEPNPSPDATLVAAAPDLLKACRLFDQWMRGGQPSPFSDSAILDIVQKAIAKAEGKVVQKT